MRLQISKGESSFVFAYCVYLPGCPQPLIYSVCVCVYINYASGFTAGCFTKCTGKAQY